MGTPPRPQALCRSKSRHLDGVSVQPTPNQSRSGNIASCGNTLGQSSKPIDTLAHPQLSKAIKRRLRETYRDLDPVALLAGIRAAQDELGERIGKRAFEPSTISRQTSSRLDSKTKRPFVPPSARNHVRTKL
jgi:hypothetical protein